MKIPLCPPFPKGELRFPPFLPAGRQGSKEGWGGFWKSKSGNGLLKVKGFV